MKYALVTLLSLTTIGLGHQATAASAQPVTGKITLNGQIKPNCKVTIAGAASSTIHYTRGSNIAGQPVVLESECNKYGTYKIKITVPTELVSASTGGKVPLVLKRENGTVIGSNPGDDLVEATDRKIHETLLLDFTEANAKADAPTGDDYKAEISFEITTGS
jgi:hypothetical protein